MSNKFDELAKVLAQPVTRRQALKKFGVGLVGIALACFELASKAQAGGPLCQACMKHCKATGGSNDYCQQYCNAACHPAPKP